MTLPSEKNLTPFLTSLGLAAAAISLVSAIAWVRGAVPGAVGRFAAVAVMAAVVLGAWASQADRRWPLSGYTWRYAVCWLVVTLLSLVCGPAGGSARG